MTTITNFQRTANWLAACGKQPLITNPDPNAAGLVPNEAGISVQIGCHIEEFVEFLRTINVESGSYAMSGMSQNLSFALEELAKDLKQGRGIARVYDREAALDALCDSEVTGNGVAYMLGMNKPAADQVVLQSNDDKLNEDGTPVILEGGKIGKRPGWTPPDLSPFI